MNQNKQEFVPAETDWEAIRQWITRGDRPYLLWHRPGSGVCHCGRGSEEGLEVFQDLSDLNGKKGVVFAPFFCTEEVPALVWQPVEEFNLKVPCSEELLQKDRLRLKYQTENPMPDEPYATCFDAFSEALRAGAFRKLVLARSACVPRESGFDLLEAFQAACRRFVYSCVYLYHTPQTGIWIGCTPEILLAGRAHQYMTVALAGTQPLPFEAADQTAEAARLLAELSWDAKNRREQQYVTDYISNCLHRLGLETQEKGPFTVRAGALAHLKTEIRFELSDAGRTGDLLRALHPTPAVCGLPKMEAARFIREHETMPRGYYSGFTGWLDPQGETELYVNLRSMQVTDEAFVLYAGGGILDTSSVQDEWLETERKMGTMRAVIAQGYRKEFE